MSEALIHQSPEQAELARTKSELISAQQRLAHANMELARLQVIINTAHTGWCYLKANEHDIAQRFFNDAFDGRVKKEMQNLRRGLAGADAEPVSIDELRKAGY